MQKGFKAYWQCLCHMWLGWIFLACGTLLAFHASKNTENVSQWAALLPNVESKHPSFAASSSLNQTPSLKDVAIAVVQTRERMQAQLPITPSIRIEHRPEPTPLGVLRYANGSCVVVINPNPQAWSKWKVLLHEDVKPFTDSILRTAAAHEMAHCMQQHNSVQANAKHQIALRANSIHAQELFADVVALLYAAQHHKNEFEAIRNALIRSRLLLGQHEATHNHGTQLKRVAESDLFNDEFDNTNQDWAMLGMTLIAQYGQDI